MLERALQIGRRRIAVPVLGIVGANAAKECRVTDLDAQHVQSEAGFLVDIRVENAAEIIQRLVDDGLLHRDRRREHAGAHTAKLSAKCAVAMRVFSPERGEVGGEAFRQPDVGPLALRDSVSEPLMRRLVRNQRLVRAARLEQLRRVEDRAGVLHTTVTRGRRDVRELFIGIRSGETREQRNDVAGAREAARHYRALRWRCPD